MIKDTLFLHFTFDLCRWIWIGKVCIESLMNKKEYLNENHKKLSENQKIKRYQYREDLISLKDVGYTTANYWKSIGIKWKNIV